MTTLFVYGLLKPGQSLHHVIAPFVTRQVSGVVPGVLYDAGVPAARFDREGTVEGVLMWLDADRAPEALSILDDVEDEGEMYRRVSVDVRTSEGVVRAESYEYLQDLEGCPPVGSTWPGAEGI